MNYYEELGIRSDADEEEIRKAHRRLVKIMHPDQHRDAGLKQLAETQMRRLNSIVATLLDPEERHEYDEQLRGESVSPAAHQSSWRSVPWWIASTLGAIILTVGAVWFFADHLGSSFQTHPNPAQVENLRDSEPPPSVPTPLPQIKSEPRPTEPPPQVSNSQQNTPESALNSSDTTVAKVPIQPSKLDTQPKPLPPTPVNVKQVESERPKPATSPLPTIVKSSQVTVKNMPLPSPSKVMTAPPVVLKAITSPPVESARRMKDLPVVTVPEQRNPDLSASLRPPAAAGSPTALGPDIPVHEEQFRTPSRDPLEGEWVYAPTEPEKRKPGFYPPEFIQLKLKKDTAGMHGEYSARYDVADNRPISPNVNFILQAVDDKALKYVWTSADGSHGWFVIRSLEPDTMRLEWRATTVKGGPALTSGMATLVRKN